MNIILSIASVIVSFLFVFYGGRVITSEPPTWIMIFGILTISYGLMSVILLLFAWTRGGNTLQRISIIGSIAFLIIFILGSLDVGMISELEWAGILIVVLMILINWFAIRKITLRKRIV
ncbi:MAG: hypothetical protein KAJ59_03985 [Thermodesulfovibrionia bacterium]|nr:hypothetical protein [Thermodesulfovibrionia bacterium]